MLEPGPYAWYEEGWGESLPSRKYLLFSFFYPSVFTTRRAPMYRSRQ